MEHRARDRRDHQLGQATTRLWRRRRSETFSVAMAATIHRRRGRASTRSIIRCRYGRLPVDLVNTSWQSPARGHRNIRCSISRTSSAARINDTLRRQRRQQHRSAAAPATIPLRAGYGNDSLDGGARQRHRPLFRHSSCTVDLAITRRPDHAATATDTLLGIENLEGGSGADNFTGNDDANRSSGNGGNDTLTGAAKATTRSMAAAGRTRPMFSGASADYTDQPIDSTIDHRSTGTDLGTATTCSRTSAS